MRHEREAARPAQAPPRRGDDRLSDLFLHLALEAIKEIIPDELEREEIAEESYYRLVLRISKQSPPCRPARWIRTVARHLAIARRSQNTHFVRLGVRDVEVAVDEQPRETALWRQWLDTIEKDLLPSLTSRQRTLYAVLRKSSSIRAAARSVDLTPCQVRRGISVIARRARKLLQQPPPHRLQSSAPETENSPPKAYPPPLSNG